MDYKNGKIYRLVCNKTGLQYIGSTTQRLSKRLYLHKLHFKEYENGYKAPDGKNRGYVKSFDILKNGDYEIVLIEVYPCDSKNDLERRERYWIESMDCVNKVIPTRSKKEYKQNNREAIQEYMRNWNEKNKDRLVEYRQTYEKEKRERPENYYDTRKDYYKERYQGKRDQYLESCLCDCGVKYTKVNEKRHQRSNKHQKWVESQNEKQET